MDEDDLKLVTNGKNIVLLLKQLHNFLRCRKLNNSSEMQTDDALMHREGLTFLARGPSLYLII